jgi:hypothetical protein
MLYITPPASGGVLHILEISCVVECRRFLAMRDPGTLQ